MKQGRRMQKITKFKKVIEMMNSEMKEKKKMNKVSSLIIDFKSSEPRRVRRRKPMSQKKLLTGVGIAALVAIPFNPAWSQLVLDEVPAQNVIEVQDISSPALEAPTVEQSQAQYPAISNTPAAAVAKTTPPALTQDMPEAKQTPPTGSERLRKERVRQELKNEELLQERIEQERLAQELERTDQILNSGNRAGLPDAKESQEQDYAAVSKKDQGKKGQTLEEEIRADQEKLDDASVLGTFVSLRPKVGMAFFNTTGPFDVNPRGSFGVEVGLEFTKNLSFDLGYSFNQYGISAPSVFTGAFAWYGAFANQFWGGGAAGGPNQFGNQDTLRMNQNVFELGLRYAVTPQSSRIRPYVTAGGAYSHSFVNYPAEWRNDIRVRNFQNLGNGWDNSWNQDYEVSSFSGYAGVGVDLALGSAVSIGLQGKYYHPIATNERGYINGYSFFYPQAGYQGLWNYGNAFWGSNQAAFAEKQQVASQLGYSGFYTTQFLMTLNF